MGLINFLIIFAQFINVLAWPSIHLMYPLYASIRAIKCDEESFYQQCLKYWVLFSMAAILECTLAKLLVWLSLWPYIKGVATILLTVPSFAGASYVYTRFVRIAEDSCFRDMLLIPQSKSCLIVEQNVFCDQAGCQDGEEEEEEESENLITCEVETRAICHTMIGVLSQPGCLVKAQREWSCPLCVISTMSEKDLRSHLKGKKHKAKSLRWSMWIKPEFGWTKLNTDGSIDRENAASFGGLLRDYRGNPICAYVSKCHLPGDDIFLAELWAIWRGLILAVGMGIKVIWVESDSMSVVKTINKQQPYGPKASSCLKHIWILSNKFDECRVSYAWRETNRAADFLSKMDIPASDAVLWPLDFPRGLSKIIEEDALGTPYYRR